MFKKTTKKYFSTPPRNSSSTSLPMLNWSDFVWTDGVIETCLADGQHLTLYDKEHNTPLLYAVKKEQYLLISRLLDNNNVIETINQYDSAYHSALHLAVQSRNKSIVQSLVDHGADINILDNRGEAPWHIAIKNNDTEILRSLLKDEEGNYRVNLQDSAKNTPLHYALINESYEAVKIFLDHKPDLSVQNVEELTPLHCALGHCDLQHETIRELIKKQNQRSLMLKDKAGNTPLHIAVLLRSDNSIISDLLKQGADITIKNKDHDSPLCVALHHQNVDAAYLLLDHLLKVYVQSSGDMHIDQNNSIIMDKSRIDLNDTYIIENGNQTFTVIGGEHHDALYITKNGETFPVQTASKRKTQNTLVPIDNKWHSFLMTKSPKKSRELASKSDLKSAKSSYKDKLGNTPLHIAIRLSSIDTIKTVITTAKECQSQEEILVGDMNGNSIAHLAARYLNYDTTVLKTLTDSYPDVIRLQNKQNNTLLHLAAQYNNITGVKFLNNITDTEGCDQTTGKSTGKSTSKSTSKSKLHFAEPTLSLHSIKNSDGNTPLHLAAQYGHTQVIKELLKKTQDVNCKNGNQDTPLNLAAEQGHNEAVKVLIAGGANINSCNTKHNTPLHLAAQYGHTQVIKELLKKTQDVNVQNNQGDTPLHFAAEQGHNAVMAVLIEGGAEINSRNNNGDTPLHRAVCSGLDKGVEFLIKHKETEITVKNVHGNTPLSYAVERHHHSISSALINKLNDTDSLNTEFWELIKFDDKIILYTFVLHAESTIALHKDYNAEQHMYNQNHQTLLHLAVLYQPQDAIEFLAHRKNELINVINQDGDTPLHLAILHNNPCTVKALIRAENININIKNQAGQSPLHLALSCQKDEICALLIDHQMTDLNALDKNECTPLHLAVQKGDENMVTLLAKKAVIINPTDRDGNIPLYYAVKGAHTKIIPILISHGADIYYINQKTDESILDLVSKSGVDQIVYMFADYKSNVVYERSVELDSNMNATEQNDLDDSVVILEHVNTRSNTNTYDVIELDDTNVTNTSIENLTTLGSNSLLNRNVFEDSMDNTDA